MRKATKSLGTVLVAMMLLLPGCGDDDSGAPSSAPGSTPGGQSTETEGPTDTTAGSTDTTAGSTDTSSEDVDFPEAAPAGEAHLDVDGQTFVATVGDCEIDQTSFVFNAHTEVDGDTLAIGGNGGGGPDYDGTVRADFLSLEGGAYSSGTSLFDSDLNATAFGEGSTLYWAGPFTVYAASGEPQGEPVHGRLSVTCP